MDCWSGVQNSVAGLRHKPAVNLTGIQLGHIARKSLWVANRVRNLLRHEAQSLLGFKGLGLPRMLQAALMQEPDRKACCDVLASVRRNSAPLNLNTSL